MRHAGLLGWLLLITAARATAYAEGDPIPAATVPGAGGSPQDSSPQDGSPQDSSPQDGSPAPGAPDDAGPATAAPGAVPDAPREPAPPTGDPATPSEAAAHGEVIEVTGGAPTHPGAIKLDARDARQTPGALGEPLRALAMLPGVTTSVAASGYPIIRGTLPGESRFVFDGIEVPLLYHLLLGSQVIHPSFIGELELRAGGAGADQGHLLGGLITMTAAPVDRTRSELRANPIEVGAFRAQRLSSATTIAVAARSGTLAAFTKIYDPKSSLYYVDQQTRVVHRLGRSDELTVTSLGAYDYVRFPDTDKTETTQLGFHRLDLRWSHGAPGRLLRVGVQSELDTLHSVLEYHFPTMDGEALPPPRRRGSRAFGVRGYADGELRLARWLVARAGGEAHHKTIRNGEPLFELTRGHDPFLAQASGVDNAGAWTSLDLRLGPVLVTPGVRIDRYAADLPAGAARQSAVDPRLAITADLPGGAALEISGGQYTAPPQVSVVEGSVVIGPLPTTDGTGSLSGLSRGLEAQAALRLPLAGDLQGSVAAYYRDTDYAIDFAMLDRTFAPPPACDFDPTRSEAAVYRNVGIRAMGLEAMLRRSLGRAVTGWVSYSLGKVDRDLGFLRLPHDYDQRHTLNVAAQWQRGKWRLGGSGHLHSGRPLVYPELVTCSAGMFPTVLTYRDPTHLRRPPPTWRVDLRAERAFQFAGWSMRLSIELQNASLTKETIDYDVAGEYGDLSSFHVVDKTLFLPLPLIGLEADL